MAEKNELMEGMPTKGASDRNNAGFDISKSLMDRVAAGMRIILGANPRDAWFGPQQPNPPVAPEETAGRQFDYPYAYNTNTQPRKDEGIGFNQLRALADNCDLLRLVIETRKDQVCRLNWAIKMKEKDAKPSARCDELTKFFNKPDGVHDFRDWLRMLLEDLLVIDAPTLYIRRALSGNKVLRLEPIDGATICPLIDGLGRRPLVGPAFSQQLKGMNAVQYEARELIYKPRNPRTHKVYGFSQVEQIILTVQIALRRAMGQFDYFESGTLPDAISGVPDTWTGKQIKDFQEYFDALLSGDKAARRRLRFLPSASANTYKEVKQPPQKDMFDEWLARIICYCFSVEVTPFVAQVNRATSETNREQSRTEGELPIMAWVKDLLNSIIVEHFGYTDVEWDFAEDKDIDPKVQADIDAIYIDKGVYSTDYVRARLGVDKEDAGVPVTTGTQSAAPAAPQLDADGNPIEQPEPELDDEGNPKPQLDAEGKPLPPVIPGAPAAGADVQATALNGTQISSLLDIITQVVEKQLPPEAAKAVINAAFPTLKDEQIDGMLNPLLNFTPEPKATPGFDEDGMPLAAKPDDGEDDDAAKDDKGEKPPVPGAKKVVPIKRNQQGDLHLHINVESPVVDVQGPTINLGEDK